MTSSQFEIRQTSDGFRIYATTTGDFGSGGGLACETSFPTEAAAIVWTNIQFAIPATAWYRQTDGSLRATR